MTKLTHKEARWREGRTCYRKRLWGKKKKKIREASKFAYRGVRTEHDYREFQEGRIPPHGRARGIQVFFKETCYYYCLMIVGLHE